MNGEKKEYTVYVDRTTHSYLESSCETKKVGETWAVSAKKAINNIKFRLGIKPLKDQIYGPAVVERYYAVEKGGNEE